MNRFIEPEINVPRARKSQLDTEDSTGSIDTTKVRLRCESQNRYKVAQSRFEFGLRKHQCYLDSKS